MFEHMMKTALDSLSALVKASFPNALRGALLNYGKELDRLRAEVAELRLKMENGE